MSLLTNYVTIAIKDLWKIPEALKLTEFQDKLRKLVLQFLNVNPHVKKTLKDANLIYSSFGLVSSLPSIYNNGSLRKADGFDLKGMSTVLVSVAQAVDVVTSLDNFQLLTIEKIVIFVKKLDVFKFLENVNLGTENVLGKFRTLKDSCVFVSTTISLWEDRNKKITKKEGEVDGQLLFKRVADSFKLAVVGVSLVSSLTPFGTVSLETRFGRVTPGKIIEGLSYFSTSTAFLKSLHNAHGQLRKA